MIDGIKIECTLTDAKKWDRALEMTGRHHEKTGEILHRPSECKLNACTFSRIPSRHADKYIFQGSLHRYFNEGGENDTDYTLDQLKATIKNLKHNYSIDPNRSRVLNFEFGVNIKLPIGMDAQVYQKYLVSAYKKAFERLNPRRPMVGYIAEFNEFSIKVYDKGYQAQTGATDQLRIEIKVNRPRWLDQYGFKKGKDLYLSDLYKPENVEILGNILINKVSSLILAPRQIDLNKLTTKQKLTFYECRDARSWEEWTSKQRERKREQLKTIFKKANEPDPVVVLADLVSEKWLALTTTPVLNVAENKSKKATFSSFIVDGIRDLLKFLFNSREVVEQFSFVVYKPRGKPLHGPPICNPAKGFIRWIDKHCRDPPLQCSNNKPFNTYQFKTLVGFTNEKEKKHKRRSYLV